METLQHGNESLKTKVFVMKSHSTSTQISSSFPGVSNVKKNKLNSLSADRSGRAV
jgi:hypothetical protein